MTCQGLHQTRDSHPELERRMRKEWNSILEDSYKDGLWNKEWIALGHGFTVSSRILSYNFLKLVYPSSPRPKGTPRFDASGRTQEATDCSKGQAAGTGIQASHCTATIHEEPKGAFSLSWPDKDIGSAIGEQIHQNSADTHGHNREALTEHMLGARNGSRPFTCTNAIFFLQRKYYYYPHCSDKEIKAQRE